MTEFIQTYPNSLSEADCRQMIAKFEAGGLATPGQTGQGVDVQKKDSLDLVLNNAPDWQPELAQIAGATARGLLRYVRQFPSLVCGAISPSLPHPKTGEPTALQVDNLHEFDDDTLLHVIRAVFRLGNVNLQKYTAGRGGYHHWHSEFYPHPTDPRQESLHRVLVFMYYLNTVAEGGETEFLYQRTKLAPQAGSLVLFPTDFTHTHRGCVPQSGDKYILTSWVLYQNAAQLYGRAPG
ncbi:2OG-Fe(II) oxygenase [Simiduia sp. 21SJ11W-1]|uniref:2OG-Fe(II) oxygenase n=1 Tax=Simiduia sp. 21SJ11W-1 TaxID=2909669 RepID=UPI00209FF0DD|nr:2OG-Fe(II) oxygenase [Simiduia sp. 21SJ11W-1]UTA49014.1 2OG-Fe(II) oxygenase [Simiduia sp. 21SJ11W-1]